MIWRITIVDRRVKVNRVRRRVSGVVAAVVMALAGTSAAGAMMVSIDGGTWDYGTGGGTVWSHYFHNGVSHGSTAVGQYESFSGCVNKNTWSRATAPSKLFGNKSYYKHC